MEKKMGRIFWVVECVYNTPVRGGKLVKSWSVRGKVNGQGVLPAGVRQVALEDAPVTDLGGGVVRPRRLLRLLAPFLVELERLQENPVHEARGYPMVHRLE